MHNLNKTDVKKKEKKSVFSKWKAYSSVATTSTDSSQAWTSLITLSEMNMIRTKEDLLCLT